MKLILLTAVIAAVTSSPVSQSTWPWQEGKVYSYDVLTYTYNEFEHSNNTGTVLKAQLIIRVKAAGHLLAKIEDLQYAQLQSQILHNQLPADLEYHTLVAGAPFEIFTEGGRILSIKLADKYSLAYENIIKGLVSALQVDLSSDGVDNKYPNTYDKQTFQGAFIKTEADVTGECETLYTISPSSAEWRRELPKFASDDIPIEIIKSKNYGSCKKRVAFQVGVPEGSLWFGIADDNEEKQFIKHTSEARIVVGKKGTIYKSSVYSTVSVSPLLFGKQKAKVYSIINLNLNSFEQYDLAEWQLPTDNVHSVDSLLYTLDETTFVPQIENPVAKVQALLQDITPLLQDPNNLPKADFLSKFNVLVYWLTSTTYEQLQELTVSLEVAKSSNNGAKRLMWTVYRDAVAQAGTVAAFRQIKSWILTKVIQGEEAAGVLGSISSTLRYPSKEVKEEFLNLAFASEVVDQKFLNTAAVLAAAKVSRFGGDGEFVTKTVIPRFEKELKRSVDQGDNNQAQVFIVALGNLVNHDVLKVFAPYVSGEIPVSKYLRVQIITSLKKLANTKDELVRSFLFSVLKNTGEPYEVRVAAALNLFMSFPTVEMFQVMAYMTYLDPSTQVRAVLTNGITFAAGLKDPRFAKLAKAAKVVKDSISKEKFGYRYSTDSLIDLYTGEDDLSYLRELAYIGSEDNILPKYQYSALRSRSTGWSEESSFVLSSSGVQKIINHIAQVIAVTGSQPAANFKFSAKDILKNLNIQRDVTEDIEGAIYVDAWNQEKLFTFDEKTFSDFILDIFDSFRKSESHLESQYIKILNKKIVSVVFPVAMGVPFVYEYSEPTLLKFKGNTDVERDSTGTGTFVTYSEITYASNLDGRVGFVDTLNSVYASSGVISKVQLHVPTKLSYDLGPRDVNITIFFPEKDTNIFHVSSWPYTSLQEMDSSVPVLEDPSTKLIERKETVIEPHGWSTVPFIPVIKLEGYSYSNDYRPPQTPPKDSFDFFNGLNSILSLLQYRQKDIALTQLNYKYNGDDKLKRLSFTATYNDTFNTNEDGELEPASNQDKVSPRSKSRRESLAKKVSTGIKSANTRVLDLSVVFDGEERAGLIFTAAIASSYVDPKIQGGFFFKILSDKEQFNGVFKLTKPTISPLNFKQALENDVNISYEADFALADLVNIQLKGQGRRTKQYTEALLNDPKAEHCLRDIATNNLFQKDCYKMIIKAYAPDKFNGTVEFKNTDPKEIPEAKKVENVFDLIKEKFSYVDIYHNSEDLPENVFEFDIQADYYKNYINYYLDSKQEAFVLNQKEALPYYPYAMSFYEPITPWERSRNWFTGYQNLPYCAIDNSKVWTYSGRSYDYNLTSSWHVVMADEYDFTENWHDLLILARRPEENQAQVYISYGSELGRTLEIDITPTKVEVNSTLEKVVNGQLTTYFDDYLEFPLLEYYDLADGVQAFHIHNSDIRILYDRQRLIIFTDKHRSRTRGLCGQSTTQTGDDYVSPWGIVDLPEHYGASFSLDGEFSDPKTAELKEAAKRSAYEPRLTFTNVNV